MNKQQVFVVVLTLEKSSATRVRPERGQKGKELREIPGNLSAEKEASYGESPWR